MTALSEYKFNGAIVRSDERYAKNYLKGKYGAIPYVRNDMVHKNFQNYFGKLICYGIFEILRDNKTGKKEQLPIILIVCEEKELDQIILINLK